MSRLFVIIGLCVIFMCCRNLDPSVENSPEKKTTDSLIYKKYVWGSLDEPTLIEIKAHKFYVGISIRRSFEDYELLSFRVQDNRAFSLHKRAPFSDLKKLQDDFDDASPAQFESKYKRLTVQNVDSLEKWTNKFLVESKNFQLGDPRPMIDGSSLTILIFDGGRLVQFDRSFAGYAEIEPEIVTYVQMLRSSFWNVGNFGN